MDAELRVAICAIAKDEGSLPARMGRATTTCSASITIRVYAHESDRRLRRGALEQLAQAAPAERHAGTRPDEKPQWLAYQDGLEQLRGRADWVALIDLDEFLSCRGTTTIQAFLAEHPALDALAVNWKMFGSSGAERREPGLVIERFTHSAKRYYSGNRAVKTLARVEAIEVPRVHSHVRAGRPLRDDHGRGAAEAPA